MQEFKFALPNNCSSMILRCLLGCCTVKTILWAVQSGFLCPTLQRATFCHRKMHTGLEKKLAEKFLAISKSGLTSSQCGGDCAKMVQDLPQLVQAKTKDSTHINSKGHQIQPHSKVLHNIRGTHAAANHSHTKMLLSKVWSYCFF